MAGTLVHPLHMFSIITYFFVCCIFPQTVCCCLNVSMLSPVVLPFSCLWCCLPVCFAQLARLPVLIGLVCLLSGSLLAEFKAAFDWDLLLGHFLMFFPESISCQLYAYFIWKIPLRFFLSALFSALIAGYWLLFFPVSVAFLQPIWHFVSLNIWPGQKLAEQIQSADAPRWVEWCRTATELTAFAKGVFNRSLLLFFLHQDDFALDRIVGSNVIKSKKSNDAHDWFCYTWCPRRSRLCGSVWFLVSSHWPWDLRKPRLCAAWQNCSHVTPRFRDVVWQHCGRCIYVDDLSSKSSLPSHTSMREHAHKSHTDT